MISISGENKGEIIDLEDNNISIAQGKETQYICVDVENKMEDYDSSNDICNSNGYSYKQESDVSMTAYFRDSSFIVNKRSKNSKVKDYYFCNVEVVANKTDQVSAGICWAAAGASIIGYLKNWSSYKR